MSKANWYEANLRCPVDHTLLEYHKTCLVSENGREYPLVNGIPVMLRPDVQQTIGLANASLARSKGDKHAIDNRCPELHLESLGISDKEKESLIEMYELGHNTVDPVVSYLVGATCGLLYKDQIGRLKAYPIPELRLGTSESDSRTFLDIGCSWGRWSIAAARKGYTVVGIDPSLGAVLAADRVADQLGLNVRYLCADARFLPFPSRMFDFVFSYSVFQHIDKLNVRDCLIQIQRVLKAEGRSIIQMPNRYGIRSFQHQIRRRFREAKEFEVRYWSLGELRKEFERNLGKSDLSVDCFFGLGLQASDVDLMNKPKRYLTTLSEALRRLSQDQAWLRFFADSVYVHSRKSL